MTRSRTGAALMLIAAFVFGGLVGGAATTLADRGRHAKRPRASYVERLTGELALTAAQQDSIQTLLARHQPAMDSLWETIRPQFQSERQAIRNAISALLTAEQQAKYAALQRQDSVRRADRSRNGHR
jgi:hypothetical protein